MAIPSVTISANKNELLIGETLTLEVKNTELDPGNVFLAYRWQKDGVDIPGATADTYTTTVDGTTAGDYTLILKHGADEESATETTSDTITVTTYSDDLVSKWTVHPIPWRDTSFTRSVIGYLMKFCIRKHRVKIGKLIMLITSIVRKYKRS
ncbi:head outer capsid protein [Klebsiella phage CPRSB]|nr:head outer capsid protein [Klebsiella phage CPRSB]